MKLLPQLPKQPKEKVEKTLAATLVVSDLRWRGEDLGGGEDLATRAAGDEGGDEGPLAAEPGKRDDGGYLTPGQREVLLP